MFDLYHYRTYSLSLIYCDETEKRPCNERISKDIKNLAIDRNLNAQINVQAI